MTVAAERLAALSGGFPDPVYGAQSVFRAVMDAVARPGTIVALKAGVLPPEPLPSAAGAIALALCDHETPVWLGSKLAGAEAVADWIRFHTGAPIAGSPDEAAFALICDPALMPALSAFRQGTAEYPDRSATLIICVETLRGSEALKLSGPGINGTASLAPHKLPVGFRDQLRANHAQFPRGVDLLFVCGEKLAALPRSTRIQGA
jgi:alpha-D-ribose 1-methylphosphonate 5-triphosphate synthase subunit PhnH